VPLEGAHRRVDLWGEHPVRGALTGGIPDGQVAEPDELQLDLPHGLASLPLGDGPREPFSSPGDQGPAGKQGQQGQRGRGPHSGHPEQPIPPDCELQHHRERDDMGAALVRATHPRTPIAPLAFAAGLLGDHQF